MYIERNAEWWSKKRSRRTLSSQQLEQLWAEHLKGEFESKDVEATLATMVDDAYVNHAGIPPQFAYPAAFGDLLAAILALASIPAVVKGLRNSRILVWIFNVAGSLDLLAAIALATVYGASAYMGPAYWIPAFWVPALLVTHYITFIILWKYWT
jgi:hypothetical protein